MDCSLSTWPSITQFDDFVWTGFSDIDPLESLERTKNNNPEVSAPTISSHQVTKPSSSCDTLFCNNNTLNTHSQSTNFYTVSPSESLVDRRWESMNAVDLTSVLDTAFPSEGVLSTPTTEDGYALYSDEMLMQPEQQLGGEVDVFMDDPLSEVADAMFATPPCDDILKDISSIHNDSTSLPSSLDQMDCKCSTVDSDTSGLINPSTFSESPVDDTHRSMVSGVDCTVQSKEASEVLSGNPAQCGDIIQSLDYYPLSPLKLTGSRDVHTANQSIRLGSKDPVAVHRQHDCTQSSTMSQWSTSQLRPMRSLKLDGGKYLHQCTVQVGDVYPGSASPQAKLVDAARLSSELKLNRAQVSRARRLAASQRRAEGRAKKYPLQKLIRMSSSTARARDRLGNSLATSVPTLHSPVHMVVQTQLPGGGQSLPMSTVNLQTPTLLPVVFQAPQMASSHKLHTHMNPVQLSPRYHCQQQQLMAPSEDNSLSSGSSAAQYPHAQQAMRSLTMVPTLGLQSLTNSANSLDATLLEQLQFVLNKMSRELRLGIRDALYRLAKSANQRQNRVESASCSDSSSSHIDPVETQTNSIDRWIVNLLFCKQPSVPEAKYQSYLPIPSNATSQSVLESASISISQPWNSCGSFLNLGEQPPHVMTSS